MLLCDNTNYQQIEKIKSLNYHPNTKGPFKIQRVWGTRVQTQKHKDCWTEKECILYGFFVQYFFCQLEQITKATRWQLYRLMSKMIQTRRPNQCRIHHTRMLKYHLSVRNIMNFHQKNYALYQISQAQALNLQNFKRSFVEKQKFLAQMKLQAIQDQKLISLNNDKKDADNIATDICWHEQEKKPVQTKVKKSYFDQNIEEKQCLNPFQNFAFSSSFKFPSVPYFGLQNYFQMGPRSHLMPINHEWIECHNLFIAWTTKLNQLMLKNNSC